MSKLQERIDELVAVAKAENPSIPEWYIILTVEDYIKKEEYEYFKDEIDELIKDVVVSEENTSSTSKEQQECPC